MSTIGRGWSIGRLWERCQPPKWQQDRSPLLLGRRNKMRRTVTSVKRCEDFFCSALVKRYQSDLENIRRRSVGFPHAVLPVFQAMERLTTAP